MVWLVLVSVFAIVIVVSTLRSFPKPFIPPADAVQPVAKSEQPPAMAAGAPSADLSKASPAREFSAVTPLREAGRAAGQEALRQVLRMPVPAQPESQPVPPPLGKSSTSPATWVPLGQAATIRGLTVKGGGYYLDAKSAGIAACVDPGAPVDFKAPDWAGKGMPYWPRYSDIGAAQRGAFLGWLNSGRDSTAVGIGYVFLYFYGIERRILVDARTSPEAAAEVPALQAEIQRLLGIYGTDNSFRTYATRLLEVSSALFGASPERLGDNSFDLALKVRVGRAIKAGEPIPAPDALAVARALSAEGIKSKWDCVADELFDLFEHRYQARFGKGQVVSPAPAAVIAIGYKWASSDGNRPIGIDLPDASTTPGKFKALVTELEAALAELEPLRKVRRSKNGTIMAEVAATPIGLRRRKLPPIVAALRKSLIATLGDQVNASFPVRPILDALGLASLTKKSAVDAIQILASFGIGVEPDPRFGNPIEGESVVIFPLAADAPRTPSPAYVTAQLLAQAAISMARAGSDIADSEMDALIAGIERQFALSPDEHARLRALVRHLQHATPSISRIEAKTRLLPEADRKQFASVLIDIAAADGQVSPAEIKLLERLYNALGLDATRVHADVHQATAVAARGGTGAKPLSAEAIATRLAETHRVQSVLSTIFVNDEEPVAPAVTNDTNDSDALPGIDAANRHVLRAVLDHPEPQVARQEFEGWCEAQGLLAEGAFEVLNDASFNAAGEALLEGDDPIDINPYVADHWRNQHAVSRTEAL